MICDANFNWTIRTIDTLQPLLDIRDALSSDQVMKCSAVHRSVGLEIFRDAFLLWRILAATVFVLEDALYEI
jgi:hypothetical protein